MGQGINRVFVDANVLYGRTQRDWFGLLTTDTISAPFRVYWTEDVLAEAIHHLRDRHPQWQGSKISAICDHVRVMWADGYVADFVIDGSYPGNDPKDAHVHAATLACSAQYLVTNNLADFPTEESDGLPYEVYRPDDFFVLVDEVAPALVASCVDRQIDYWTKRQDDVEIVEALTRADCPQFAERVVRHLRERALRG